MANTTAISVIITFFIIVMFFELNFYLFAKLLFLVYLPKGNHFHNLVIDSFSGFFSSFYTKKMEKVTEF